MVPDKIFDVLPAVLKDAPPLPGEAARYEQVLAVIAAAQKDPELKKAMIDEAAKADKNLVDPLLQFRNYGVQLPNHWSTVSNGAAFGTDYFTRTAVGKSNIFVNKQNETKYFYQDLDQSGARLNGAKKYTVTYRQRPNAARARILVADALQPEPFLFAERHQTLLDRHEEQDAQI